MAFVSDLQKRDPTLLQMAISLIHTLSNLDVASRKMFDRFMVKLILLLTLPPTGALCSGCECKKTRIPRYLDSDCTPNTGKNTSAGYVIGS